MSSSPSRSARDEGPRRRLVPNALGRVPRRLSPAIRGDRPGDVGGHAGRRDLEIAATTIVAMATLLSGPLVAVAALLLLAAVAFGSLQVLAEIDAPDAERGVPVESLILPSVAALGAVGAIRLVPVGPLVIPALAVVAVVLDRALVVEARILRSAQGPTGGDRTATLIATLVIAFIAFTGIAAIVPAGLAGTGAAGAPPEPLPLANLVVLALSDALVAGLLGYRTAALRAASARGAAWAALSSAAVIAIGAAGLRATGVPRLIGPALLMFLLYLWDTLHAAPPSRRRDPRWIWETAILAGLGIAVIAWNLRLDG